MALVIPGREQGVFEQVNVGTNWSDDKKWSHIAGKVGEFIEERMSDLVNEVIDLIEDEVAKTLHKVEEEDDDDYGYSRFLTERVKEWPEFVEEPETVEMEIDDDNEGDDNEGDDYTEEDETKSAWSGWDDVDDEESVAL